MNSWTDSAPQGLMNGNAGMHLISKRPKQNGRLFADNFFKCILLMKTYVFWSEFQNQHWVRKWLGIVQAPRHYPYQIWQSSLTHICIFQPQWVIILHFLHTKPWIPGRENRYQWLLFTSEECLCCYLSMQEHQGIWRHNANTWCSCTVTDQLWWFHNSKSEKTILGDNGEMSDR